MLDGDTRRPTKCQTLNKRELELYAIEFKKDMHMQSLEDEQFPKQIASALNNLVLKLPRSAVPVYSDGVNSRGLIRCSIDDLRSPIYVRG